MIEERAYGKCEFKPCPISLGYYGDIELVTSSCCDADTENFPPNYCPKCGAENVILSHGRERERGEAKIEMMWQDDEDGVCWICSRCGRHTINFGDKPSFCPSCGVKAMSESEEANEQTLPLP